MRYGHFDLLPERAFSPLGKSMTLEGGGKSGGGKIKPATINMLADKQMELNNQTLRANRPNEYTPLGSRTWENVNGDWTSTINLDPEVQNALNQSKQYNTQSGVLANTALGNINTDALDLNSLPSGPINPGQTAQDAIMSRLNPQFQREEDALRTRLANQGINQNTDAWRNEFTNFNQGKNDAYSQAALRGIDLDFQNRNNALNEFLTQQNQGLNVANSLNTGNQVALPQFQSYGQSEQTPDIMSSTLSSMQNNANASSAKKGNTTTGVVGIAGAAAAAY